MNARSRISLLILSIMPLSLLAAEAAIPSTQGKSAVAAKPASSALVVSHSPQALLAKIDAATKGVDAAIVSKSTLTTEARSTIGAYKIAYDKDSSLKKIGSFFTSCSLVTEGAVLDVAVLVSKEKISSLVRKHNAILIELNEIHEKIIAEERSNALRFKEAMTADLDSTKRKSEELRLEAERSKAESERRRLESEKRFSELQSTFIQVKTDARGTIISMSDILFDVGKATLTADLKTSLAKIAGILLVFKDSRIGIEGHTDNVGSEAYNQDLSEKRAKAVLDFLVVQGISEERLSSVGYGFSKPVADNATKEGRQKNRRVDLVIQEKKVAN